MSEAIWHDVECGAYAADLPLWEEMAEAAAGPVLELGCGTGRVALHLARRGHEVAGVDSDGELVGELARRAAAEGLALEALAGDARDLGLGRRFGLVIAPMQLIQLLRSAGERRLALSAIARHLAPGGVAALAIVEDVRAGTAGPGAQPLPDVREAGGWVYSSLPLEVAAANGQIRIRRLRQTVSPAGELSEREHLIELATLDAAGLEAEALAAGMRPHGRHEIAETEDHMGSLVLTFGGEG